MILTYDNYNLFINAKEVKLGKNIHIGENVVIRGPEDSAEYVEIGDNTFLDDNIFIMTPYFKIGDYCKIYKNCRISGYKPCTIGHNFWCDQNTILNCTDTLEIGNNVGIGAYSQLWTHIKFGDILEGCRFNSTKPMLIEDDVWFVGHCIVSPIHAGKKSMALVGSVITKDMEENHIYGGAPAKDLTDKLGNPYVDITIDKKFNMLNEKLDEFSRLYKDAKHRIKIVLDETEINLNDDITYFIITKRKYTKKLSSIEVDFMKFLLPLYKFTPYV
jgi:acetyltransferase-like isoleucine patch superfamily enzyme